MGYFLGVSGDVNDGLEGTDDEFRSRLWRMYWTDITIHACRNLLQSRLLGLGVMFSNGASQVPQQVFYEHVQTHFGQFCKDFLDSYWVQGVVPYQIVPGSRETNNLPYPRVVPPSAYTLHTREKSHFRTGYFIKRVRPRRGQNGQTLGSSGVEHKVFFAVGNDVDMMTGHVCSTVASIQRLHSFGDMIERNVSFAESVRCRPPVVTRSKTDHTFDERDITSGGVDGLRAQGHSDQMGLRNRINNDQHKQQEALAKMLNAGRVDTSSAAWQQRVDPVTGLPVFDAGAPDVWVPDFVPLPMDAEVATINLPQSRNDLVDIQKHIVHQTCIGMGVSPASLQQSSSRGSEQRVSVQMSDDVINFTLMRLKHVLSQTLIDIYRLCFDIKAEVDGDGGPRKRPRPKVDVTVVFPGMQRPDTLRMLHNDGVLTYEAYTRFLKSLFELSEEDLEKVPPNERSPVRLPPRPPPGGQTAGRTPPELDG